MMAKYYIIVLLISGCIYSCNFNQSKKTDINTLTINNAMVDLEKLEQMTFTNPEDFRNVLDQLDQGDLVSLDVAGRLFKNCVTDTLTCDSMFTVFNDFYNLVAGNYLENNEKANAQLENSPSTEAFNQLKSSFGSHGILLSSEEGTFSLEPQTKYLLQNFGAGLSPAYREFLAIGSEEQQTRFAEDGTILIPLDSLASRIIRWESFMERYPVFISIKMAQDQYAQYLGAFLAGLDNSRVFDPETNRLNDKAKVSFESFIVKNPESKTTSVVKEYLDLLKSTNFNYNERVDSFLLEKVYH